VLCCVVENELGKVTCTTGVGEGVEVNFLLGSGGEGGLMSGLLLCGKCFIIRSNMGLYVSACIIHWWFLYTQVVNVETF
jgi:hypothetical protein